MTDAHTHIDQYTNDLPKALGQIRNLGIQTLSVSMDIPSFRRTQRIAKTEPLIHPSFGIHPWKAPEYVDRLEELVQPLEEATILGEIGLCHRFVTDKTQYQSQKKVLNYFLDHAEQTGKLINLHTSGAEAEILECLAGRNLPAIIVHWYAGPIKLLKKYLDLGTYFTIGVEVLQSKKIQKIAKKLPKNRILTETDNPSGWEWMKDEKGFPELIESVELKLGQILGLSKKEVSLTVASNFHQVLKKGGIQI